MFDVKDGLGLSYDLVRPPGLGVWSGPNRDRIDRHGVFSTQESLRRTPGQTYKDSYLLRRSHRE